MAAPRPWTDRERHTLAELAETFVRGDAVRRARLAAEALDRAVDPDQVGQLRLVLRLLESRLANLLLTGRPVPFRSMSPRRREALLLGWAGSRLGRRRSAFQALRRLLTFLAYADPGGDGPNPRLAAIGYQPDDPPVAPEPPPIVPVRLPLGTGAGDPRVHLEADAVVVGSGAAGGVVAAELARAGRSVVVLEAGPWVDEASMPLDELAAFDRLYLQHGLLSTWDGAVTMLAGAAVGGGTLVNWTTCLPAPAGVREEWEREHGIEGLTDRTWTDDVRAVEDELGVAETPVVPAKDEAILRGAAALGWDASRTRRDAVGCVDCGSCPFGCRRGTKRSGIRSHLAAAAAAGARIAPGARGRRILVEAGRAVGVEAEVLVAEAAGESARIVVRAPIVVVAAGALRTPAVLAASGLAHPAIGRHLRIHPTPVLAATYREPVDMWRGPSQAARSLEFAEPAAGRNGYVIESAPGHPGLLALALPWEGTDAHADTMAGARRIGPLIAVTRDGGEGRTTLTKTGHVRVDYRLDEAGRATLRHAMVAMARLARAAGAQEIVAVGTPPAWHGRGGFVAGEEERAFARFEEALGRFDFGPNRGTVFSAHQMGTARMGADPRDHPCDPWGRVRADDRSDRPVGGLYVADGSLFPTGLGVNPMITIMALARRVARTILAEAPPSAAGAPTPPPPPARPARRRAPRRVSPPS